MTKQYLSKSLGAAAAVVLLAAAGASLAESLGGHAMVSPDTVKWGPGPASIPPGAEAAVLYGDPSKPELFALRLKMPAGYAIAPHWHSKPEIVTVVSGTFQLGMGETADPAKVQDLPAGGFVALPPKMAHFAYAKEETVIQLNSTGPWSLTYIDPKDDPRQKTQ